MATAVETELIKATAAANWSPERLGCSIKIRPASPSATLITSNGLGARFVVSQERTKIQSGYVLVRVSTSPTGSLVSAKKEQTRLKLPAKLRTQSVRGFQMASGEPASLAAATDVTSMKIAREKAIVSQSQRSPIAWVSAPMTVNEKAPEIIQKAGRFAEAGAVMEAFDAA